MIERHHSEPDATAANAIVLASASPRRLELLRVLGLQPEQRPVDIDESRGHDETVLDYVSRMATEKARCGADGAAAGMPVLGGDTVVCLGEQSFGKPRDDADAENMLKALSGRSHDVHSAVCLIMGGEELVRVVTSTVTFAALDASTISNYVATGEPHDKAGGYAIQGLGACFVSHLKGSYFAVMGLPLFETAELLRAVGVDVVSLAAGGAHE